MSKAHLDTFRIQGPGGHDTREQPTPWKLILEYPTSTSSCISQPCQWRVHPLACWTPLWPRGTGEAGIAVIHFLG